MDGPLVGIGPAPAARRSPVARPVAGGSCGHGVHRHDGEGIAVADDRHPGPGRQRLADRDPSDVDQLVDVVDHDQTAVGEDLVDRPAASCPSPRRRGRAGARCPGAAGAHHDHRLDAGQAVHEPGELARVADGLQVEQRRGRCRDPPASTAAGRCRRRRRGCRPRRRSRRRAPSRRTARGWTSRGRRTGRRSRRARRRACVATSDALSRIDGVGVDEAQGIGADHAHARAMRRCDQLRLSARARRHRRRRSRPTRRRGRGPRRRPHRP